jgi:hypothetical protein
VRDNVPNFGNDEKTFHPLVVLDGKHSDDKIFHPLVIPDGMHDDEKTFHSFKNKMIMYNINLVTRSGFFDGDI